MDMIEYEQEVLAQRLHFVNDGGRRLVAVVSEPRCAAPATVVLVPGYQQTIAHLSLLSRSLVRHGYRTVRFDLTNHVGQSDGDTVDLTVSSMAADVAAVLVGCAERWAEPVLVVGTSLGARAVVRVLGQHPTMSGPSAVVGAVLVLPVVDVEYTIVEASGRPSVFDAWRSGAEHDPRALRRVVDHDVAYEFVRDAIDAGYAGVAGTTAEISSIRSPILAIAAEHDDWVRTDDVDLAMTAPAPAERRTVILSATSHELSRNPPVMRLLLEQTVAGLDAFSGRTSTPIEHLSFEEILDTVNRERDLARAKYVHLADLSLERV